VAEIKSERTRVAARLAGLAITTQVFDSQANFLLVRCVDARRVLAAARAAGIIIRDRSGELGLANCVRITIGTREENEQLLAVLAGLG
jgi:histidinol-phosphate aminotransferase